jgi:hypothetical protein
MGSGPGPCARVPSHPLYRRHPERHPGLTAASWVPGREAPERHPGADERHPERSSDRPRRHPPRYSAHYPGPTRLRALPSSRRCGSSAGRPAARVTAMRRPGGDRPAVASVSSASPPVAASRLARRRPGPSNARTEGLASGGPSESSFHRPLTSTDGSVGPAPEPSDGLTVQPMVRLTDMDEWECSTGGTKDGVGPPSRGVHAMTGSRLRQTGTIIATHLHHRMPRHPRPLRD